MSKLLGAHYELNRLAALLDMSPQFIKDRIKKGDLAGYRMGNRIVVQADSVQTFLAQRAMQPT